MGNFFSREIDYNDFFMQCQSYTPTALTKIKEYMNMEEFDINRLDVNGRNCLHIAINPSTNNQHIIEYLLKNRKLNVNVLDSSLCTPLMLASLQRFDTNVRLLLKRDDLDLSISDGTNMSVLHTACLHGYDEVSLALIEDERCNINKKTKDNITPLLYCLRENKIESVKLLLEKGALLFNDKVDIKLNAKQLMMIENEENFIDFLSTNKDNICRKDDIETKRYIEKFV